MCISAANLLLLIYVVDWMNHYRPSWKQPLSNNPPLTLVGTALTSYKGSVVEQIHINIIIFFLFFNIIIVMVIIYVFSAFFCSELTKNVVCASLLL